MMTFALHASLAAFMCLYLHRKWVSLSPESRALHACRTHYTTDRRLPVQNPNLCETCIGDAMPAEGFMVANTGVCGKCGQTDEVWDLEHLAQLKAEGFRLDAKTGISPARNPIRNSHTDFH